MLNVASVFNVCSLIILLEKSNCICFFAKITSNKPVEYISIQLFSEWYHNKSLNRLIITEPGISLLSVLTPRLTHPPPHLVYVASLGKRHSNRRASRSISFPLGIRSSLYLSTHTHTYMFWGYVIFF